MLNGNSWFEDNKRKFNYVEYNWVGFTTNNYDWEDLDAFGLYIGSIKYGWFVFLDSEEPLVNENFSGFYINDVKIC